MEFRIGRKKGDESTMRIVRRLNGDFYGVFGTVEDLCKQELLAGVKRQIRARNTMILDIRSTTRAKSGH